MSDEVTREIRTEKSTLAGDVADRLLAVISEATAQGALAHISLTGGSMGEALLAALPTRAQDAGIAWERVHVWWSDERWVEADSDDRNDRPALPVLRKLGIPEGNIHSVATSDRTSDLDEAAAEYAQDLARFAESTTNGLSEEMPVPAFDVMLLGVGPDGHIASLFPEHPAQNVTGTTTVPVTDSPKPPPLRVSMTFAAINAARRVWFTVAGDDKADAVARALTGDDDPWECPASAAHGRLETTWWLDDAAAAKLKPVE